MEPVLIWIDNNRIRNEKAGLNNCIPLMQNLYDAFADINISVTIQDLASFKHWSINGNNKRDFIEDFVVNQLVQSSGGYKINDLSVKEDKFKAMIDLPDLTDVKRVLRLFSEQTGSIRINLLTLANNTISKVPDADAQITTEFTYYTKTDASAQLATDLLAISQFLEVAKSKYRHYPISAPIGLVWRDEGFGLDLTAIRNYERELSTGGYLI